MLDKPQHYLPCIYNVNKRDANETTRFNMVQTTVPMEFVASKVWIHYELSIVKNDPTVAVWDCTKLQYSQTTK